VNHLRAWPAIINHAPFSHAVPWRAPTVFVLPGYIGASQVWPLAGSHALRGAMGSCSSLYR